MRLVNGPREACGCTVCVDIIVFFITVCLMSKQ